MKTINDKYIFFDPKYAPIFNFFGAWSGELINCLNNMKCKSGNMRDFHGYEYEENDTVTFYDFNGAEENSVNVSVKDLLILLKPIINDYVAQNPSESTVIENIVKEIKLV